MTTRPNVRVVVTRNGPYKVSAGTPLSKQTIGIDTEGGSERWIEGAPIATEGHYELCRCGHSKTKPFCDGTHEEIGFDGTETASRAPYLEQAQEMDGPELVLTDAEGLCAFARFCDPNGTVWEQVARTDDPKVRAAFLKQVHECPSGRLTAWDKKTKQPIEKEWTPSIGLVEDPAQDCSGPLWLRGRIQVTGSDGFKYELRNQVTLCRCGESKNKPFCDGTHAAVKFKGD